jgi:hypothetical protein
MIIRKSLSDGFDGGNIVAVGRGGRKGLDRIEMKKAATGNQGGFFSTDLA